jgi:CRP-like cAMP-binding protein
MNVSGGQLLQACLFGLASAAALPLGALVVRLWVPANRPLAALMGFGAGALISALAIDLVAEAVEAGQFAAMAVGGLAGGLLFVGLNKVLNERGAFLRKASITFRYLKKEKTRRLRGLFERLVAIPFFNRLPPEEIAALVPSIRHRSYQAGSTIIRQGEPGDSLFIVERGSVDVMDFHRGEKIATLSEGEVFGEMSLLTGEPRSATAVAAGPVEIWLVLKEDFDRLLATSPHLGRAVSDLAAERMQNLRSKSVIPEDDARRWLEKASQHANEELLAPTTTEIREAASAHEGAPLAIWLGTLLDGIPESVLIGASLVHGAVSLSLLAGVFLSNFPEALSSSTAMRRGGMRFRRIFWMWMSLLVLSGACAVLGRLFFGSASASVNAALQGVGAGAMLTMVADTMLPEASEKGGTITGIATLAGFLAAVYFKTLG